MTDRDISRIESRLLIAEAAVSVYASEEEFSLANIAESSGVMVSDLFVSFPNKRSMLHFWYEGILLRYEIMLEEFDDAEYHSLTLSEKLANLMLSVLDMMEEQRAFTAQTFNNLVFNNREWHPFKKQVSRQFKNIIEQHDGVSQTASVFLWDDVFDFMAEEFLHVIKFWIKDESGGRQKTMALVDKLSGFTAEILCNRIVDSGIDLGRFFWQEGIIKIDVNIPFVGRIKSGPSSGESSKNE